MTDSDLHKQEEQDPVETQADTDTREAPVTRAGAPEEEEEPFSFLQERVKRKPIDKKKTLIELGKRALAGAVFGVAACLAFYCLSPVFKNISNRSSNEVTIPQDEPDTTETQTQDSSETQTQALTVDNYAQMYNSLNLIAAQAKKSVVTVTGVTSNDDWFNNSYTKSGSVSGVIVAKTSNELLILAPSSVASQAKSLTVTFYNALELNASVKMVDRNTGLGVYSVTETASSGMLSETYPIAELGNSYSLSAGNPVILMGSPFGVSGGQAYGVISSISAKNGAIDGSFTLLSSDVSGADSSSGVFVNLNGEVVGFITPDLSESGKVIKAYSISGIKNVIEKLSNGTPVAYLGIAGTDIDQSTAASQGLEVGIFVTNVAVDSPAMAAGIQNGDIIQYVDGQEIITTQALRATIMNHSKGNTVTIKGKRLGAEGYTEIEYSVTFGALD